MSRSLKTILTDHEFWLIAIAAFGFAADAAAEGKLTPWRVLTIVAGAGILLSYTYRKLKLHREKHVPFLVVAGKPDEQYRDTLSQVESALGDFRLNVERLEKTFGLLHEDWIFHREACLPTKPQTWRDTIRSVERKFWRIAERLPGRKVYHIFMNGPATLAVALGATFGSRSEFAFYHYQPGTGHNPYHPVVDFSAERQPEGPHILKSRLSDFQFIESSGLEDLKRSKQTEVLVAVNLAGHDPIPDVQRLGKEKGWPVVTITSKFSGTIPLDIDWVRLARETSTVLLSATSQGPIERLHLFLSAPLAIAFCVGTAIGKFVRATFYNYFPSQGKYCEVYRLEEL